VCNSQCSFAVVYFGFFCCTKSPFLIDALWIVRHYGTCSGTMDSTSWETQSVTQLKLELGRRGISPKSSKEECIQQLVEFEASRPSRELCDPPRSPGGRSVLVSDVGTSVSAREVQNDSTSVDAQEPWKMAIQQLSLQMKSVLETLASISNASLASPIATISNTHCK